MGSPSKEVTSSSAPSPPISLGSPSSANGTPVAASTIGKGDSQDAEGEKKKKKRTVRKKLASDNATFQDDIAVQGEDGASLDSPKEENEEKKEKKDKKRRKQKKMSPRLTGTDGSASRPCEWLVQLKSLLN